MKIDIENIAEKKANDIANSIFEKYGVDPVIQHNTFWGGFLESLMGGNGYSRLIVEREIYQRSLHEATAFFLGKSEAKFDEKIIEILKSSLEYRLENPKEVRDLKSEELLANLIKCYAMDSLSEKGLIL